MFKFHPSGKTFWIRAWKTGISIKQLENLTTFPKSISLYFVFVQIDKIRTVFTKKVDESKISGRVINS